MKRTYTTNRTKKDETMEYMMLAIVAVGLFAGFVAFLFEAHIL